MAEGPGKRSASHHQRRGKARAYVADDDDDDDGQAAVSYGASAGAAGASMSDAARRTSSARPGSNKRRKGNHHKRFDHEDDNQQRKREEQEQQQQQQQSEGRARASHSWNADRHERWNVDSLRPAVDASNDEEKEAQAGEPVAVGAKDEPPAQNKDEPSDAVHVAQDDDDEQQAAEEEGHGQGHATSKRTTRNKIYGNYQSYHRKLGGSGGGGDPRLALVPSDWLRDRLVLDVGCNAGAVTLEVALSKAPERITGVDIDPDLIKKARRQVDMTWSRQTPLPHIHDAATALASASQRKRGWGASFQQRAPKPPNAPSRAATLTNDLKHFPLALPRLFGFLPQPPPTLVTAFEQPAEVDLRGTVRKRAPRAVPPVPVKGFPENLRFRCADWVADAIPDDTRGYDTILALSVTKWIHLNALNEGLFDFFAKCFKSLHPGGRLVLEPQPFWTYRKSAQRVAPDAADDLRLNLDALCKPRDAPLPTNVNVFAKPAATVPGKEQGDLDLGNNDDDNDDDEALKGPIVGWRDEQGDFERVLLSEIGFTRKERLGTLGTGRSARNIDVYYKDGGSWM